MYNVILTPRVCVMVDLYNVYCVVKTENRKRIWGGGGRGPPPLWIKKKYLFKKKELFYIIDLQQTGKFSRKYEGCPNNYIVHNRVLDISNGFIHQLYINVQ